MHIEVMKSKIHHVTVTQAELHYVGSITIDEDLLDAANMVENEKVTVVDVNNGGRRMARGTGPQGSVFGNGVPWARGSSPEIARPAGKDSASAKSIESPLNNAAVSDAGANAGAAIQKSTMRPGGIAEQGFAGTAGALPFQSEMEQSFGRDLSGVKVYADANAKLATEKLGAEADADAVDHHADDPCACLEATADAADAH